MQLSTALNLPNRQVSAGGFGYGSSLALDFTSGKQALDPRITFTRASTATYFNSAGVLTTTGFNLLLYSGQFDNAAWTKLRTTIAADAVVSPDGMVDADKLVEDTSATTTHIATQTYASFTSGVTYSFTLYAKAAEKNFIRLSFNAPAFSSSIGATFNLTNGAIPSVSSGVTATSTSVGNGWYRVQISAAATTTASSTVLVALMNTDGTSNSFTGNGTSGVYIWGAQLETGSAATVYIPTTSATSGAARFDYDPVTLAPKGLLIEESRTNLSLYSEQFDDAAWTKSRVTITADAIVSPDGTMDADKMVDDTQAGSHTVRNATSLTITSGTTLTASVFAKAAEGTYVLVGIGDGGGVNISRATFNLSTGAITSLTTAAANVSAPTTAITSVGNGWYRCVVTATVTGVTTAQQWVFKGSNASGAASYTGNGTSGIYIWGAQLEAGAFATSYIPAVASQVTRAADVAVMTGTNFSSWYNATAGTMFSEASTYDVSNARVGFGISDNTAPNRIQVGHGGGARLFISTGGVTQLTQTLASVTLFNNTASKIALAYELNNGNGALNGTIGTLDTAMTIPTVTQAQIGGLTSTLLPLNGHIQRIAYYNRRLTNAELQGITS